MSEARKPDTPRHAPWLRDLIYVVTLILTSAANYGATKSEIASARDEIRLLRSQVWDLARNGRSVPGSAVSALYTPCAPDATRITLTTGDRQP